MVQLAARLHILDRARFFQQMLEGQLLHLIWSLRSYLHAIPRYGDLYWYPHATWAAALLPVLVQLW